MQTWSKKSALALASLLALSGVSFADDRVDPSLVRWGLAISPIPPSQLNLRDNNADMVGFGSYVVNAIGDCSGCHSFPQYLEKGDKAGSNPSAGDPYEGALKSQSVRGLLVANFNVSHYLAGGQCFGPFMARNLTRDTQGLPEGLTEAEFITVMRTGEDIHCEKAPSDPICAVGPPTPLLQVMPWPTYHSMTDLYLKAIYAYLRAIPVASACNTVADGCPSGSAAYVYPNTPDCPNPAPPQ